jgi:hypothetical protein
MSGSLRWGYLAAYLGLQHLFAGVLVVVGIAMALQGGWLVAGLQWLVACYWLLVVWREAFRAVIWFRLDGDTLTYRTFGSARQRTLSLTDVQKVVLYRGSAGRSACGFIARTASRAGRLGFDFYWLSGSHELWKLLQGQRTSCEGRGPPL